MQILRALCLAAEVAAFVYIVFACRIDSSGRFGTFFDWTVFAGFVFAVSVEALVAFRRLGHPQSLPLRSAKNAKKLVGKFRLYEDLVGDLVTRHSRSDDIAPCFPCLHNDHDDTKVLALLVSRVTYFVATCLRVHAVPRRVVPALRYELGICVLCVCLGVEYVPGATRSKDLKTPFHWKGLEFLSRSDMWYDHVRQKLLASKAKSGAPTIVLYVARALAHVTKCGAPARDVEIVGSKLQSLSQMLRMTQ